LSDKGTIRASSALGQRGTEAGKAGPDRGGRRRASSLSDELADLRRQIEAKDAELRETKKRLWMALSSARMGTWEWNLVDGRVTWSDEQYRLLGHEPGSVEASVDAFQERVHPEDRGRSEREFDAAIRERRFFETEYRVIWPNGETHWLQARGDFVFDANGKPVRMFGVTLDFDRLKQAEQAVIDANDRLSTIAEATPGTIFTYRETVEGRRVFTFATQHLRETHGIDPEELKRDPSLLLAHIHPDDAAAVAASSAESGRTMTMWHCQFRHQHPEKGEVWLEAYSSPIRDPDGGITWHGIAHDITHVKRAEIELLLARERAEAADRAKSEFLANMSHEIRTPMAAILGYAEILSAHLKDPDDLQSLATIRSNGRYLLEIIDDILDLSRIEAGKVKLDFEEVRLDRLVLEVHWLFKVRADQKGLRLVVQFDGCLPQAITTDAKRLRQILINLVENAIKFTDEGEVRIVTRFLSAQSRIQIDVIDTGIGVPTAAIPQLFRPFSQADSSATRRFSGSGLGLSISRALAKLLGGDVVVESQAGGGSKFTVTLAAGDVRDAPMVQPAYEEPTPVNQRPPARRLECRVLVVDDRRDMRHLVQQMLEEAGAQVALAVDGRDALAHVAETEQTQPFDVILLDMQMPVLDGYSAAAELRRRGYREAIIAMTAHAMKEDEGKCLASGCDGYLSKPLERERLVSTIDYYTSDRYRAERESKRRALAHRQAARLGHRVLVVDDDDSYCKALKRLLETAGCKVATATTGLAALGAAGAFDAVLLDLSLPDMAAAEVLTRLRQRDDLARCRFICVSGRSTSEFDWRTLGFDQYVQKPAGLEALEQALGPRAAL
jgi:signal transduction histidine kinase/CheY-like chemotaxis protein